MQRIRVKREATEEVLFSESESETEQQQSVKLEPEDEDSSSGCSDDSSPPRIKRKKSLKQQMKATSPKKDPYKIFARSKDTFDTLLQNSVSLRDELETCPLGKKSSTKSILKKKAKVPPRREKEAREKPRSSTAGSTESNDSDYLSDKAMEEFIEKASVTIDEAQVMQFDDREVVRYINSLPDVVNPLQRMKSKRKPTTEEMLYFVCKKVIVIEKQMQLLIKKQGSKETVQAEEIQMKFTLPCKDAKRVFLVDKILSSDKAQFKLLVKVLASLPPILTTCRLHVKVVNKMLRHLMTDTAATQFCLTGSADKYEFKSTMLHEAVIAAIRSNYEHIGCDVISRAVASWLSQAKKRIANIADRLNTDNKEKKPKKKMPKNVEDLVTSQSESDSE